MNSLKNALSKEESHRPKGKQQQSIKTKYGVNSSKKGANKSSTENMWAFDVDQDINEDTLRRDQNMSFLNDKLRKSFSKDNQHISDIAFERIVEEFQDDVGGNKSEVSYLKLIDDKLIDIAEICKETNFKNYISIFAELVSDKIDKLRKKQKKSQLSNYDKIVSGNFKKMDKEKKIYLQVEDIKPERISRSKDKPSKSPNKEDRDNSNSSRGNKLNSLLSKDRIIKKQKQVSSNSHKEDNTVGGQKNENVSFSTVLATSVAVKQRRRKRSNQYDKQQKMLKEKEKQKETTQQEQGDEAFIFFRPKKGKK